MIRYFLAVLLVGVFLSLVHADDREERDRRARAILALTTTKTKKAATIAPAPRSVEIRDYPAGYTKATRDTKPLVVFVGCKAHPVEGAIVSHIEADAFGETKAPAVVVGYPVGDRLLVEAALKCPTDKADLARAVKAAAGKIPTPMVPAEKPVAPKPLSWKIGAEMPRPAGCRCEDPCKCEADACPNKCPVAPVAPVVVTAATGGDGLDEVNAKRAQAGLRPFLRDEGLTMAAKGCSEYRAANQMFGHTHNDFGFCPPGVHCDAAGCAAYPASYGWMSCCTFDNYRSGGAYWTLGADGKRYMHLFVSYGNPSALTPPAQAMPAPNSDSGVVIQPAPAPQAQPQPQLQQFRMRGFDRRGRPIEWYEWHQVNPAPAAPPVQQFAPPTVQFYPQQLQACVGFK